MTQQQTEAQFSPNLEPDYNSEFEGYDDTYSFGGTQVYTLPDGKQWIAFKIMNEGDKAKYQRATNRDIKINRKTEDASFRPDAAADRHALILAAVTDWNLATKDPGTGRWSRMSFNYAMLQNWLKVTNPKIVEELEKAIRKVNPWLNAEDATEEELEEAIADLQEQLVEVRKRNEGKGA